MQGWFQTPEGAIYFGDRQSRGEDQWDEPVDSPTAALAFKWKELENSLRGSPLFGKLLTSINENGKLMALSAFNSAHNPDDIRLADLQYGITLARSQMPEDYTEAELQEFRDKLAAADFPNDWI